MGVAGCPTPIWELLGKDYCLFPRIFDCIYGLYILVSLKSLGINQIFRYQINKQNTSIYIYEGTIFNIMVSIQFCKGDPIRLYGINHFSLKYGIPLEAESREKSKTIYPIDLVENEIADHIVSWITTDYGAIPLFEELKGPEYVEETAKGVKINYDVFLEVGCILSGHLENLDAEERKQIAKIPLVDIHERILFDILSKTAEKQDSKITPKPFWPEGKKFAVCLTHDVDEVRKTTQYLTRPMLHLKRGELSRAVDQAKSSFTDRLSKNNPYWTFRRIMDIEEELDVRSTFYFLQEDEDVSITDPKTWRHYPRKYRFDNLNVSAIMRKLSVGGWEVGLHGSFQSHLSEEQLRKQKKELEEVIDSKVSGIRQHHLNLQIPETWRYHEKIGLEYDTSLGFKDDIGFRWGTCFPFHPFDKEGGKQLLILEIPLIIMDTPLFYRKEEVWPEIESLINTVEKQNGVLTILFHHSAFNEKEYPGWTDTYKKVINLCKQKNAWITTADAINKWWTNRTGT